MRCGEPLALIERYDRGGYRCADATCEPFRAVEIRIVIVSADLGPQGVAVAFCRTHGELWGGERAHDVRFALRAFPWPHALEPVTAG